MKEIKMSDTRRRVKLYMLNNSRQWDDRGTGHVLAEFSESAKCVTLQVRAESDGTILLNSSIQSDTAYQKQQETLIVWSETEHSDLALSFQEKAGCDEIWEKICEVQGKDPSVDITQEVPEDSEDDDDDLSNSRIDDGMDGLPHQSTSPYALPQCVLSELDDISECFTFSMRSPVTREQLARSLEENNYIPQLIELFRRCEDLEDRDSLHKLYEIVKIIFLLNKSGVFDVLIQEEHIMSVIGCLEYDPALSEPRRHRTYLSSGVSFKEVLPITNVELRKKIHQTFRLQYIQDVVLPTPSVFEENMLSTLASVIFFNKVEIVSMVQDDPNLLPNLFKELSDDQVTDHRRRELAGFLRELCLLSQTLQPSPKDDFFKYLLNLGLLPGIEQLFACDDHQSHRLAIDIFQHVVEHSPSMVRDFANQEMTRGCGSSGGDNNNTSNSTEQEDFFLLNMVIEQMICDPDPELSGAMQLNGLLRILLDPENMLAKNNEKTEFLGFFYRHCMHVLMAPVLANTADEGGPSKDDYQTAHILSLILDLVTFSVEHHTYHVKNYIMSKDLLRRVLVLLKSNHKFLGLSALRFMRKIVGKLDEVYNRYIIKGDLMKPVVNELFVSGKRYNLINSAILEMFEFINTEKVRSLTHHIVSQHYKRLQEIDYVQTFTKLKITYDQQQERVKILHDTSSTSTASTVSMNNSMSHNHRFGSGGERETFSLDEEEEMWFEREGDDDDDAAAANTSSEANATSSSSELADLDAPKRHNRDDDDDDDSTSAKIHSSGSVFESTVSSTTRNNGDSSTPLLNSTDNKIKISINIPAVVKALNGVSPVAASSPSPSDEDDDKKQQPTTKNGLVGGLVDYSDDDSDEDDSVSTTSPDDKTTEQNNELKGAGDNNSTTTTTSTEKPTEGCGAKRTPLADSECPSEPASKKARLSEVDSAPTTAAAAAAIEASE